LTIDFTSGRAGDMPLAHMSIELVDRTDLGSRDGRQVVTRLLPAVDHLMHVWMPGAHVPDSMEPANHQAIRLYRDLGFETERLVRDYFGPKQDRLVMTAQLRLVA
jgi:ribosomal protein S18 acetylase RimI-like enzyme